MKNGRGGGGGGGGECTAKIVISWGLEWREGVGKRVRIFGVAYFFIKWTLRKHKSFIIRG